MFVRRSVTEYRLPSNKTLRRIACYIDTCHMNVVDLTIARYFHTRAMHAYTVILTVGCFTHPPQAFIGMKRCRLLGNTASIALFFLTGFGVTELSDAALASPAATSIAEVGGLLTIVLTGIFSQTVDS